MTRAEWLLWRLHLWRQRLRCQRDGHDIIGPGADLFGTAYYQCARCPYRFLAAKVIQG